MPIGQADLENAVREGWIRDEDNEISIDGYNSLIQISTNDGTSGFNVQNSIGAVSFSAKSDGDGYFAKRLGIGTYNPQYTLEVIGTIAADNLLSNGEGIVTETTFQENKNAQAQINQIILQALDGYTTSASSGVSEQTFQENKDAWNEIDHQILVSLDGYALRVVEDQRWIDSSQQLQDIRDRLDDGYVVNSTFEENRNSQSEINNHILTALDGYAQNSTVTEHYAQLSQAIQDIISTIDGYSTDVEFAGLTSTVEENKSAQAQTNQSILQTLDGYALLVTENQRWVDTSQQLQDLRDAADGYGITIQEHAQYQDQFNQTVIQSLDGYAVLISGLDLTELQHTQQQNQINQSILQSLDGYITSASSGVNETTFQENKNAQNEINYQILVSIDGYASKITESEHYTQLSQAIQDIVGVIDGYSTDIEFTGLTNTVEEHKSAQAQINQSILQSLDGYAIRSIEDQRWVDSSQQLQDIRDRLIDGYVSEITFQENKNAQSEINHQILIALDGYTTTGFVIEQTFQENKNAQNEINYQILVSLDGYASKITEAEHYTQLSQAVQDVVSTIDGYSTDLEFAGLSNTVEEHKNYQNQFNQSLAQALDGYATLISGLDSTELQHKQYQDQVNQSVVQALDGYAVLISGLDLTETQHTQYQNQFNQLIIQTLDGYATLISGLDTTELEHTQQQNQINQTILQALDGYTTSVSSGVSEQTFQENKDAQNEINHQIVAALDGYVYSSPQGVSNQIPYFTGGTSITSDVNLSYDTANNRLVAYSLQMTGGFPDDGYVLTSDANGVGTWKRPPIAFASNLIYTVDATHPSADFTTIQAAINNASDGYIILVSPGTYNEQLTLRPGLTVEIRGTGPDYASSAITRVMSVDGYLISSPESGAGSIIIKNMNINLLYNGITGSTATILSQSASYGMIFKDCYISTSTFSASGGQTHAVLANAGTLEFWNCEIVADDNDGINNVEVLRQSAANVSLYNTTMYGFDNYDIHVDDPAATLVIENSYIGGAVNVVRAQNVILNKISHIGALSSSGIIHDDDNDTTVVNRVFGVGLTNGTNDFYKLHLRELGGDVTTPGDGQIWYNRAAGRFRMKENGTVKDMIPYSTLDGYGSVGQAPSFTGSDGYIAFFTADKQIAGDNDLFWHRGQNRLGVNTIAPGATVEILGDGTVDGLKVTTDRDGYAGYFFNDGNSANRVGIAVQCGQDNPSTSEGSFSQYFVMCLEGDASLTGYLAASSAGVVAVTDTSDEKLKTNIAPSKINGLNVVEKIGLIEYNRKKKNYIYPKVDCGFSAQNLQKAYPSAVQKSPDGSLGVTRTELIPVLIKAVQEQQQQIKEQQAQLDELKALVKKLIKE